MMTSLINWFLVLIGVGTKLGKDPYFSSRDKVELDGHDYVLSEIGAIDRQAFIDQLIDAINLPSVEDQGYRISGLRLGLVACSLRNRHGWFVYDPTSKRDIQALGHYPPRIINDWINQAADLACIPELKIPEHSESDDDPKEDSVDSDEEEEPPANP